MHDGAGRWDRLFELVSPVVGGRKVINCEGGNKSRDVEWMWLKCEQPFVRGSWAQGVGQITGFIRISRPRADLQKKVMPQGKLALSA